MNVFQDTLGWFEKDKWFFWDEAGLENGPHNTKEEAEFALDVYVKYELQWEHKKNPIKKMRENMGR